jgi:glycosyltransferase involved in cell wall biosynthesis
MLRSAGSADVVAYLDADLASPPSEMLRLLDVIGDDDRVDFAMGSRVALLGTNIERSRLRHYQGRIFATLASLVLGLPVYDTQCGLKAIRTTPALYTALATPFRSRWVFDVELIARMMDAPSPLEADRIREVPLEEWRDVGDSRLSVVARFRSVYDLLTVTR